MTVGTLRGYIDRTQAARLYAGNIEYGYFVREMEARCQQAGVQAGQDADQLITFAASLPEEQLRSEAVSCTEIRVAAMHFKAVDLRRLMSAALELRCAATASWPCCLTMRLHATRRRDSLEIH